MTSLDIDLHHLFSGYDIRPHWLMPVIMISVALILIALVSIRKIKCHE